MPAARRAAAHYFVPAFRDFSLPSSCVSRLHSLGQGAGGKGCCPAALLPLTATSTAACAMPCDAYIHQTT